MNWEIISATGEWAGAIAVVVTLFYLAQQIKSSTDQATAEAESASQLEFIALTDRLTEPKAISVMRRGFHSFSSLSDEDKFFFHLKISGFINYFEAVLRRSEKGLISDSIVQTYGNVVVTLVGSPGGREFWAVAGANFQQLSTRYINEHIDKGDWAAMVELYPHFVEKEIDDA